LLLVAGAPALVAAHGAEAHSINTPQAFSPWDVAVLALLVIVGTLYLFGVVKLARRKTSTTRTHSTSLTSPARLARREPWAFAIGWSALVVSVLPPLDSLSLEYFSVHMIQHELMMLVGAPLLILGRPLQRCLAGLPDRLRSPVAHALQTRAMSGTWRVLTAPLVAWALHGLAIWVWHMPVLYDAAVGNMSRVWLYRAADDLPVVIEYCGPDAAGAEIEGQPHTRASSNQRFVWPPL